VGFTVVTITPRARYPSGIKVGPCRWPSTAPIGRRGWPTWWARNTSPRLWRELWTTIAFTTRTFSPAPAAVAKRRQLESWRDRSTASRDRPPSRAARARVAWIWLRVARAPSTSSSWMLRVTEAWTTPAICVSARCSRPHHRATRSTSSTKPTWFPRPDLTPC